ncbi:hypothetical protein ACFLWA_13225 [Chloroflexota bacterium]
MQGQLRGEPLSFQVSTECAHCGQALHLEIDSELNYSVAEEEAEPMVFIPQVDFEKLEDTSIIDAF